MQYYQGTYQQCLDYNEQVKAGEAKRGAPFGKISQNWAQPIETATNGVYAIPKHKNYTCALPLLSKENINWPIVEL